MKKILLALLLQILMLPTVQADVLDLYKGQELTDLEKDLMKYENSIMAGRDPKTGLWKPHKSIEGGADTQAFGDKLYKGKYPEEELRRRFGGINDQEALETLRNNIVEARMKRDRTMKKYEVNPDNLTDLQKRALTEMAFQLKGFENYDDTMSAVKESDYEKLRQLYQSGTWGQSKRGQDVLGRLVDPSNKLEKVERKPQSEERYKALKNLIGEGSGK